MLGTWPCHAIKLTCQLLLHFPCVVAWVPVPPCNKQMEISNGETCNRLVNCYRAIRRAKVVVVLIKEWVYLLAAINLTLSMHVSLFFVVKFYPGLHTCFGRYLLVLGTYLTSHGLSRPPCKRTRATLQGSSPSILAPCFPRGCLPRRRRAPAGQFSHDPRPKSPVTAQRLTRPIGRR